MERSDARRYGRGDGTGSLPRAVGTEHRAPVRSVVTPAQRQPGHRRGAPASHAQGRKWSNEFFLNNRRYYQRLVLDQGYWARGTLMRLRLTPSRVELTKAMGFNGARKHPKIEVLLLLLLRPVGAARLVRDARGLRVHRAGRPKRPGGMAKGHLARPESSVHRGVGAGKRGLGRRSLKSRCTAGPRPASSGPVLRHTHALDGTRPVISNDGWQHARPGPSLRSTNTRRIGELAGRRASPLTLADPFGYDVHPACARCCRTTRIESTDLDHGVRR